MVISSTYGLRAHAYIAHDDRPTGLAMRSPVAERPSGERSKRAHPSACTAATEAGAPAISSATEAAVGTISRVADIHSPALGLAPSALNLSLAAHLLRANWGEEPLIGA